MLQSATDQQDEVISSLRIGTEEVVQMVNDLFSVMLEMPITSTPQNPAGIATPDLQASISISGDWKAECHVLVSEELASRIAGCMFDTKPDELSDDEILDALGEVANVLGGNAKGMVDVDCTLSLPCVSRQISNQPNTAVSQTFKCDGLPLTIVVVEN